MRTSILSTDIAGNARFINKLNKISSSVVIKPASFGMKAAVIAPSRSSSTML